MKHHETMENLLSFSSYFSPKQGLRHNFKVNDQITDCVPKLLSFAKKGGLFAFFVASCLQLLLSFCK